MLVILQYKVLHFWLQLNTCGFLNEEILEIKSSLLHYWSFCFLIIAIIHFWSFTWCLSWTLGSSKCSSLNLFQRYYFGRYWSELAQLVSLPYSGGSSTRFSDRLQSWFFCHHSQMLRNVYVYSFFPGTAGLWNSLPIECFPFIYDSNGFKYIINRQILTAGFF